MTIRPWRFYCVLNFCFNERKVPAWSAACQSVKKKYQSLGSPGFAVLPLAGKQTRVKNGTPVSKFFLNTSFCTKLFIKERFCSRIL